MTRSQGNDVGRIGANPTVGADEVAHGTRSTAGDEHGVVPEDNRPGHHPAVEQDRPDPEAFLARSRQVAPRGGDGDDAPAATMLAADPEAAATSPSVLVRSAADGLRRFAAGVARSGARSLRRLGDAIDPG